MSPPTPTSSAGSTRRRSPSRRHPTRSPAPSRRCRRSSRARARRGRARGAQDYLDNLRCLPMPGDLDMGEVMATVRARLPADAIFTNGAGNFSVWAHRFYEFRDYPTQLAPTSGAMGYGVPAAVAAKLLHPERDVVAIAGDGDFLMTGQELATAVQYDAPIVVLDRQQRHVRDDSHAPGAALPRPRLGHRPRQPRLRRAGAGVRRARGGGRAHRGLRRCLRRGARAPDGPR